MMEKNETNTLSKIDRIFAILKDLIIIHIN